MGALFLPSGCQNGWAIETGAVILIKIMGLPDVGQSCRGMLEPCGVPLSEKTGEERKKEGKKNPKNKSKWVECPGTQLEVCLPHRDACN